MKFYIVVGVLSTLEHFFLFWMYFSGSLCIFFSFFVDLLLIILFFSYIAIFSGNVFIFTDFRFSKIYSQPEKKDAIFPKIYFQYTVFCTRTYSLRHLYKKIFTKPWRLNETGISNSKQKRRFLRFLRFFTWKSSAVRCFQCKTL